MAEFDDPTPKKKSSWLMTCGILFVVLGLGFLAVVGVAGYYAYTLYYAPAAPGRVAGLLSVVNNTPDAANVDCSAADGDAWAASQLIPAGETAQVEIGHRPVDCTLVAGTVSTTWWIKDPPAADETWTVSLAPAEVAAPVGETLTLHNRSGWVGRAVCTAGDGTSIEPKELLNGLDAEITIPSRPATCTITAGMGSQQWTVGTEAAATDTMTAWLLPDGDGFALSPTEVAAPVEVAAADGAAPADVPPTTTTTTTVASTTTTKPATKPATTSSSTSSTTSTTSTKPSSASSTTTKPATTTTTTTTSSSTAAGSGAGGGTRASPAPEEEDEELPDSGVLTAVRVEWAKGAKKSTPWTVTMDGKKVGPVPTKSLVSSGVHKIKVTATGEDPVSCTVTASGGEDITFSFDPADPACPR